MLLPSVGLICGSALMIAGAHFHNTEMSAFGVWAFMLSAIYGAVKG